MLCDSELLPSFVVNLSGQGLCENRHQVRVTYSSLQIQFTIDKTKISNDMNKNRFVVLSDNRGISLTIYISLLLHVVHTRSFN